MYPPGSWGRYWHGDCMELETFAADLQKRYSVDLAIQSPNITLGELYALCRKPAV
jgi:hypothetical protein